VDDDGDVGVRDGGGDALDRRADAGDAGSPALAPVHGHEQVRAGTDADRHCRRCELGDRIDDRVAGQDDVATGDALGGEVGDGTHGGGQVKPGDARDERAVALFGERLTKVVGAQAGLEMDERDPVPEGGQAGHQGGQGVALDEHGVRTGRLQLRLGGGRREGAEFGEAAGGPVQRPAQIRDQPERGQPLGHAVGVLADVEQQRFDEPGVEQGEGDGGGLHRLRARPHGHQEAGPAGHGASLPGSGRRRATDPQCSRDDAPRQPRGLTMLIPAS